MANRVLRRLGFRTAAIFSLSLIVAGAWALDLTGAVAFPTAISPRNPIAIGAIWVPIFAGQAYLIINLRRLKRRLRETNGQVCPNCAYDLRGTEAINACPECGKPTTAATLHKAWTDVDWRKR